MRDQVLGVLGRGLVDPATPLLPADDLGVLRGDGCFETVRIRDAQRGALDDLEPHLARLADSARRLDLPIPDLDRWRELVAEVVGEWAKPGEAVLRLVLTRGQDSHTEPCRPTSYALVVPVPEEVVRQRQAGVRVVLLSRGMPADAHVGAPWLLGGVKTTSYALNMAALRHAESVGAEDVIFVSSDGLLLEAPTATVVWAAGEVLHTPPPGKLGILDGTTVRRLFGRADQFGFDTAVSAGRPADLRSAAAVWLVSSVRVAVPVHSLDGVDIPPDPELTGRVHRAAGL